MASAILLIHLGGLGDVCLSESTFHSLNVHFEGNVHALGYKRFLALFDHYFAQVLSVEERSWLWLFSDLPCDKTLETDGAGRKRQEWRDEKAFKRSLI